MQFKFYLSLILLFSSVQLLSHVWLFATSWPAAHQASLSITNSRSLLKLMSIESVIPSNHLILCPSPFSPTFKLSQHQSLFQWVGFLYKVTKVLEFQLPMNIQNWFPLGWIRWISCSTRDSQESSPTPQFKSSNSLALSFLYSSALISIHSVQFSSVAQSCPTLCDPMNHSTPGLPVHHQLPEFTQTHVHRVGDAIQSSHPLSSPSLPVFNPSQHQGLFQWVNSLHQVVKVLELQLQHQSFQWIFRTDFLWDWLVGSCSPRDSQESSPKPPFKSISSLVLSFLYGPTLISTHDYWKNHSLDEMDLCAQNNVSAF